MKIGNVGISEKFWKGKTFSEFEKAFKGKLRSGLIKEAYDKLPKADPKPIVLKEKKKEKEVKEAKEDK